MPKEPQPQTPESKSELVPLTDSSVLPFGIDAYLPNHHRPRAWLTVGRLQPEGCSIDGPVVRNNVPPKRKSLVGTAWRVLTLAVLVLLVFGIIRLGIRSLHSSYPGVGRCYQIELWFHDVRSDFSRIQWAMSDAEEEISNTTEAEEANLRIGKMFSDMRTSIANRQAPEEVAELKVLWLQFLDLGVEIGEAPPEDFDRLQQEQNQVFAQRREEERRVLHSCRLAEAGPGPDLVEGGGNHRNIPIAIRNAFYEGVI